MDDGFPARLTRLSRRWLDPEGPPARALEQVARDVMGFFSPTRQIPEALAHPAGSLRPVASFGANPGGLGMLLYEPARPPRPDRPLLVLLHGCTQDAGAFALASGFMALADRLGAPLLLPEQRTENNARRCFNWFEPGDIRRGGGEAASVRAMVETVVTRFRSDPVRVFIAGLSAGGAMAAALLAAYPDVFAAGAVVAGLPVGTAHHLASAMARMRVAAFDSRETLAERAMPARAGGIAWPHLPRLSVWHGATDQTVDPANSDALAQQWTALLGLPEEPDYEAEEAPGVRRRVWGTSVEQWRIDHFGHAWPAPLPGADPFVQPAPVAATEAIARFWGLERR
jgi:poly(hydroxyalkanoate) depolymerase family esterase